MNPMLLGILPEGYASCTACGSIAPKPKPRRKRRYVTSLRVPFAITYCTTCGHLMHRSGDYILRDMTPGEAGELAASPDFQRVLKKIEEQVTCRLIG